MILDRIIRSVPSKNINNTTVVNIYKILSESIYLCTVHTLLTLTH